MAFTTITTTQTEFLVSHLRGTGRTLSEAQARSLYGIKNLRARMSELRKAGYRVRTDVNASGKTVYAVSRRVNATA
jgi:hypothetical protein